MKQEEYSWLLITEKANSHYLDFSVNTNSLGIPDTLRENFSHLISVVGSYPDTDCVTLSTALAEKYKISSNSLLCGNGADDLLYRLVFALKPHRALIIEPTYEEYNRALELVNCNVYHYQLSPTNQFELSRDLLTAITKDLDIIFLCNPNNPTGNIVRPQLLGEIIEKCQKENVFLVVDECFLEFIQDWETYTLKSKAAASSNLVVIDAFTKTYSLAGFRLGFCISGNDSLLENMKSQGQSYGVSVPAQFAGVCALMDQHYLQETYAFLSVERTWLYSQLHAFDIEVWPSQGNFLLFKTAYPNLRQALIRNRIKVRDCSQFYGLGPEYCRIAVRSHEENVKFIEVLRTILK
ncbi:L-threonine O-3-phosphate decarboxylase [Lachnospiraceae bacterium NLAE-zl-G231]|uniref:pyridoxal phosphate-dependent aminotransferase n=1 Tax=Enterocloster bolteae TaxID=208479 RepID=UPI0008E693CB|nr:L-threonine O-3-phosphate decarboxylase [Lachnospiraceae bacterium NLAE-zl-G231]